MEVLLLSNEECDYVTKPVIQDRWYLWSYRVSVDTQTSQLGWSKVGYCYTWLNAEGVDF